MRIGPLKDDSAVRVCATLARTRGRRCSRVGYDAAGRKPRSVTYLRGNKNIRTQTADGSNLRATRVRLSSNL